jgi:hydroxymethylpyrimidine pyrophosphatase-like HAD family hydrolase
VTKLFVSDLDGTLLPSIYGLAKQDRKRLAALIDSGLPFTFATSRAIPAAIEALGRPPLQFGRIGGNGAAVENKSGEPVFETALPWEFVLKTSEKLRRLALPFIWALDSKTAYERRCWIPDGPHHLDLYLESCQDDPGVVALTSLEILRGVKCLNLSTAGPRDLLKDLAADAASTVVRCHVSPDPYQRGVCNLIMQGNSDKGTALVVLCKEEGISPQDVTVFGDSFSDLPLFKAAGRSIAVENAPEEVKDAADEVIGPAVSLSVLTWLERRAAKNQSFRDLSTRPIA